MRTPTCCKENPRQRSQRVSSPAAAKKRFSLDDQKVLIVVGKGGTGRTTVARILAEIAAKGGKRVSIVAGGSATNFQFSQQERIAFVSLEPGDVLTNYLRDHGLGQLGKKLTSTGLAGIISTAIPGIADLLVLAKIKQMEKSGEYDLIIFDAPASGHFLRLISTPKGLAGIASGGPLQKQSQEVLEMLRDPKRVGIVFVTLAEETPVNESIETMEGLKNKAGITPRALFVNSLWRDPIPPSSDRGRKSLNQAEKRATDYIRERVKTQKYSVARAEEAFNLDAIEIPLVPTVELASEDIVYLGSEIERQIRVGK